MQNSLSIYLIIFLFKLSETIELSNYDKLENKILQHDPSIYDESFLLGIDPRSGCMCRKYPVQEYTTCYNQIHCIMYPRDVKFHYPTVRITTSAIKTMKANDLQLNPHLTTFTLEVNDFLATIEPGTFNNMSNLLNVTITHNKQLFHLHAHTFDGLINLKYLILCKNGFHEIKDFSPSLSPKSLPRLERLIIAQNVFLEILEDDFKYLKNTSIKIFELETCSTAKINPNSFNTFANLTELSLVENNLDQTQIKALLEAMLHAGIRLEVLHLLGMNFRELPMHLLQFIAGTNLTRLGLSKNRFEVIEKFPLMKNIVQLDLSEVLALNISPNAFITLPNLKILNLDHNEFSDIPEAVLLPQLISLDLSFSGKYMSVDNFIFKNMSRLKLLNFSGNNLRQILNNTLFGLKELEYLRLEDCMLYYVDEGSFMHLPKLKVLNLIGSTFAQRNFTTRMFDGLDQLRILKLDSCKIAQIDLFDETIFSNLKTLKRLSLSRNYLKSIAPIIFTRLPQLEYLDISKNAFLSWNERLFTNNTKLKTLIASDNKIRNITKEMVLDVVNLNILELYKNPFQCTCDDLEALHNVAFNPNKSNNSRIFELLQKHLLNCTYPEEYYYLSILDYLHDLSHNQYCYISTEADPIVYLVIPITLTFIFITLIIFTIYYFRWHIRYWIFLTKLALNRSGNATNNKFRTYNNYEYDAFVSYSNEDRQFVVRLVTMLENYQPFFKLCVYERDFQIGTVISETVLESVAKSRKTLLIISDSYIRSQWCRWEAQVAENHRLFFENEYGECVNDSIVMIKLGDVGTKNLSPMLKYLMKTRIYLQWDSDVKKQKVFWEKLRNSLARPTKSNVSVIEANLIHLQTQ